MFTLYLIQADVTIENGLYPVRFQSFHGLYVVKQCRILQAELPGLPTHARVTFGYRLDALGIRINDAFVVLPNGDSQTVNDWVWQVLGDRISHDDVTIHVLPLAPDSPPHQEVVYSYDDFSVASGR